MTLLAENKLLSLFIQLDLLGRKVKVICLIVLAQDGKSYEAVKQAVRLPSVLQRHALPIESMTLVKCKCDVALSYRVS
jgi:hypothetical protein